MTKEKKTSWGGKRKGSGQPSKPPEDRKVKIYLTLYPETITKLDTLKKKYETSRSEIVDRLVKETE